MIPLLFTLALQAAPIPATEAPPTAADTLAGLEETYRTTCGETGILYHAYDDLCDTLRKQIGAYRNKMDRDEHQAASHKVVSPATPKP